MTTVILANMKITKLRAREILDSRGNPTVEVELTSEKGSVTAGVPSGASTGVHEALELRDNEKRYNGKGVQKAVKNAQNLEKDLLGSKFQSGKDLDLFLLEKDGTPNKSNIGANAILGISMAFRRLQALEQKKPLYQIIGAEMGLSDYKLPVPMMNIMNGGAHANNGLDIQEFMIIPKLETFSESLRAGAEIFHQLKKNLNKANFSTAVGDEGGFAPNFERDNQALEFIAQAVKDAGYELGKNVNLSLDVAASELYEEKEGCYFLGKKSGNIKKLTRDDLANYYKTLIKQFSIVSIEDGFAEDDVEGWKKMSGFPIQLVGDDLLVTNVARMNQHKNLCNAILIKLNQIGTVHETLEAIKLAKTWNWGVVVSHRSGETSDTFISDLAVGTAAGQIKTGSLSRSDRVSKYNQILRIEEDCIGY